MMVDERDLDLGSMADKISEWPRNPHLLTLVTFGTRLAPYVGGHFSRDWSWQEREDAKGTVCFVHLVAPRCCSG